MNRLVELRDVDVAVDLVPIISAVSLHLDEGECVGIQGPNGAGKTTLLRVIATLLTPTGGSGTVLGAGLGSQEIGSVRPNIGLAGHVPALAGSLTLLENLLLVARLTGHSKDDATMALARVGLAGAAGRPADRCSHGMRRRTDLARLFLAPPRLLLLDEPHAGLDAAGRDELDTVLRAATAAGATMIVASHELDRAGALATRVVDVVGGQIRSAP